jgi:thiol-disulfide isomerase/thioredoxin
MAKLLLTLLIAAAGLWSAGCSSSAPPPSTREPVARREVETRDRPARPAGGGASLFRLPLTDGQMVTVKTPAALYFFTTWCAYCRGQHPAIQAAAERAKAKGWRVYGIDVGERPNVVANYMQQYQPRYPVLLDQESEVAQRYNVTG